jgi:septal ring factor EnvC (AmiA/AmiB activator)
MSEAQKWAAYNVAENRLSLLISHYESRISEEEKQSAPDESKLAMLCAAQDSVIDVRDNLTLRLSVDDQEEIERINTTYGPVVAAVMAKIDSAQ